MAHSLASLQDIVDSHNRRALAGLHKDKAWLFPPTLFPSGPGLSSTPAPQASVSSLISGVTIPTAPTGTLNRSTLNIPCLAQVSLTNAPSHNTEAVFSVIDSGSSAGELPVVLCVGINYGQFKVSSSRGGVSHAGTTMLLATTGMLSNVIGALKLAGINSTDPFHLVAANFFPWITNLSWGETVSPNDIKEAILLQTCGYEDPVAVIADLVDKVKPELLVFHGANNCVPALGLRVLRTAKGLINILCDNLGYPVTYNSIIFP